MLDWLDRVQGGGQRLLDVLHLVEESITQLTDDLEEAPNGSLDKSISIYVRWAYRADGMLKEVIGIGTSDKWIYDDGYWKLRTQLHMPKPDWFLLYSVERTRRVDELKALAERVGEMVDRWCSPSAGLYVVDTNALLNFSEDLGGHLARLKLPGQAPDVQHIRFVIPLVVLNELDKLKRPQHKVHQRARAVIAWLDAQLTTVDGQVEIHSLPRRTVEYYAYRGALKSESDADLAIIEDTLELARFAGPTTTLVTFDIGMYVRAMAHGVTPLRLVTEPRTGQGT